MAETPTALTTSDNLFNYDKYSDHVDKTIIKALEAINSGNGTFQKYIDAGIKGVTEDNLASVNEAIASAKMAKSSNLTIAEIKTAVTYGVASVEITRNSDTLTAELKKADGNKYTNSNGSMAINTTIDDYVLDTSVEWIV